MQGHVVGTASVLQNRDDRFEHLSFLGVEPFADEGVAERQLEFGRGLRMIERDEGASVRQRHQVNAMAAFLGIDYLLIGGAERRAYHPALLEIAKRPDLFPQLFKNGDVTIYGVKK